MFIVLTNQQLAYKLNALVRAYIYLLLEKWYGRGGDGVRVRVGVEVWVG